MFCVATHAQGCPPLQRHTRVYDLGVALGNGVCWNLQEVHADISPEAETVNHGAEGPREEPPTTVEVSSGSRWAEAAMADSGQLKLSKDQPNTGGPEKTGRKRQEKPKGSRKSGSSDSVPGSAVGL